MTIGDVAGQAGQVTAQHGSVCTNDYIIIEGMLCVPSKLQIYIGVISFPIILDSFISENVKSFNVGSSSTGTALPELQNRYCGGILGDFTSNTVPDSIIGKYQLQLLYKQVHPPWSDWIDQPF